MTDPDAGAGSSGAGDSGDPAVEPVRRVTGTAIPVRGNDIDTDQIIPGRFLKVVTFDGLGEFVFFDQRFDEDDEPKEHPFNDDRFQNASVLVVNANFGCGSSREHAPQALMRWGIDAVIGESFAEIFAGNCLALGIPTVTAPTEEVRALQDYVDTYPDVEVSVDVASETIGYDDRTIDATVEESTREALVEGIWDTTGLLGSNPAAVRQTLADLPYTSLDG